MSYQSAFSARERDEAEYIAQYGENGVETIVDFILDDAPEFNSVVRFALHWALIRTINNSLSTLESAEWVSRLFQGPSFEEWLDNQVDSDEQD